MGVSVSQQPSHQRQTKTLKHKHTQTQTFTHAHILPRLGLLVDNTVSGVHHHTHRYSVLTFAVRSQQSALACKALSESHIHQPRPEVSD